MPATHIVIERNKAYDVTIDEGDGRSITVRQVILRDGNVKFPKADYRLSQADNPFWFSLPKRIELELNLVSCAQEDQIIITDLQESDPHNGENDYVI